MYPIVLSLSSFLYLQQTNDDLTLNIIRYPYHKQ